MTNGVNAPLGLQPRQYFNGDGWDGQTSDYPIASGYNTDIFTGDPVYWAANGTIVLAAAGNNPILGVFFGVKYTDTSGTPRYSPYWAADTVIAPNTTATALIVDDPGVLYDVQADSAALVNGIAAVDLGTNAIVSFATAGSTISGQSGVTITGLGNGPTLQLKIIRLTPNPKNAFGINSNNVLVMLNNNPYKGGTGTAGV